MAEFKRRGQQPPCEDCDNRCPELLAENYTAWYLYSRVQTQYNYTFGGVVGLDYPAVFATAEILGIEITPSIMAKIQLLEHEHIKEVTEKNGRKS